MQCEDTPVVRAATALIGTYTLLIAHELKVFPILSKHPLKLSQVAAALGIAERPAEAMLSVVVAQGFVDVSNGEYSLTSVAEKYLLPESPTYYGGMLDLRRSNLSLHSVDSLKQAILSDSPQAYGSRDVFAAHAGDADRARAFTRAMHSISAAAAQAWPRLLDLSHYSTMLDVAGGSGSHSIGAAMAWSHLNAIVFDMQTVCQVAAEYAAASEVSTRIRTHTGDMWRDAFPSADLHFYANIFHDWPPEKNTFLAQKSFDALPPGGRLIVHEMLYEDDKKGPLDAAIYSMIMLLWSEGRQYSGAELVSLLTGVGFVEIEVRRSFGLWSIVTGVKPLR